MPSFEIRKTETGNGLFATERISQGKVIMFLPKESQPLPDMYSIEVMPGIHINCADSPAGSLNHSCDPNAFVRDCRIVAWACIAPGDQITIDYKKTEQKLDAPFDCKCGAAKCRGRIE